MKGGWALQGGCPMYGSDICIGPANMFLDYEQHCCRLYHDHTLDVPCNKDPPCIIPSPHKMCYTLTCGVQYIIFTVMGSEGLGLYGTDGARTGYG